MIDKINKSNGKQFIDLVGGLFEHSPWIAEKAAAKKPFSSLSHLHQEMVNIVKSSSFEQQLALIRAHPNLGDRVEMTSDSLHEQKGAGLQDLTSEEYEKFIFLNKQYIEKFGFPFIIAVRGKNKHQIYREMETRIHFSREIEFQNALSEIYQIAWLRLLNK